jgi:hypothetical protein
MINCGVRPSLIFSSATYIPPPTRLCCNLLVVSLLVGRERGRGKGEEAVRTAAGTLLTVLVITMGTSGNGSARPMSTQNFGNDL